MANKSEIMFLAALEETENCTNFPCLKFLMQTYYKQFNFISIMIEFELRKILTLNQFHHFKSYEIQF